MKTTILLLVLIFGYITPTYSQLNRHRKMDATSEQFQNKKNDDFVNYKYFDKFSGAWSDRATGQLQHVANKTRARQIYRGNIFTGRYALFPTKVRGRYALFQTKRYIPYESLQT